MKKVITILLCILVVAVAFAEPGKKYRITEESLFETVNELMAITGDISDIFYNYDLDGVFKFGESDYLDAMLLSYAIDELPLLLNMSIEFDKEAVFVSDGEDKMQCFASRLSERIYLLDDSYGDYVLCYFSKDFNKLYFVPDSESAMIFYRAE